MGAGSFGLREAIEAGAKAASINDQTARSRGETNKRQSFVPKDWAGLIAGSRGADCTSGGGDWITLSQNFQHKSQGCANLLERIEPKNGS